VAHTTTTLLSSLLLLPSPSLPRVAPDRDSSDYHPHRVAPTEMALVSRDAVGLEYRVERDMAAQCSNYQQLNIMKKKFLEDKEEPEDCRGLTRSERLLWYRNNQGKVELDNFRCSYSSNYRQLQLARGVRREFSDDEEDEGLKSRTKSQALLWYRSGGEDEVEDLNRMVGMCGNWKQFHLMTRPRMVAEEEGEERIPTRTEKKVWYRSGGEEVVAARDQLCRDSSNYMQYKLARDTSQHAQALQANMNTSWSRFKSKEALSDYLSQVRVEGLEEREMIRAQVRNSINKETVAYTMLDIHKQPFELCDLEQESKKRVAAGLREEQREVALRMTTEEMATARNQYMMSTRELAMQAIKEDEQAVAASRQSRKTTVVQQQQASSVAA